MTPQELRSRYDHLFSIRKGNIEQTWDEIEEYIMPIRGGKFFQDQRTELEIQQRRPEIWDLTAIYGAQVLSASMQSSLTSPAIRWFRLAFKSPVLNKDKESRIWLDACSDAIFDGIQESNFNVEISSAYQDLVGFGNTAFTLETMNDLTWEGFDFSCLPIREIYFEPSHKGHLMRLFRRHQWTPGQIVDKFKEQVPSHIREAAATPGSSDHKKDVIFCIYQRDPMMRVKFTPMDKVLAASARPFVGVYLLHEDCSVLGTESGYYEMPAFLAKWEKTSGSMWGHGPGAICIPTVKYLNAWMQTEKAAGEKVVDPAMMVTERGLVSDLDMRPGGLTVVRSKDDLAPFKSGADFSQSRSTIQELRLMVNRVFRVDDLQLRDSPAMTATEVQVRYELMNRVLGATVTRLQTDLLDPLITRCFRIMARAGALPAPPRLVQEKDPEMQIQYQGPLMRAQRADEVGAIERVAGTVSNMLQAFPEVRDIFDPIHAVREIADRLGVPATVLNSDAEVLRLKKQREAAAAMQQKMAAAQLAEQQGKAAQSAVTGQSMLDEAGSQFPNPLRIA